ncbi:MAG TPA: hypothetical protein VHC90_06970 [Bryobacteraceae bacterium]|nr:hypothetical protein [Bryobacteraceae bacterium]
MSKSIALSDDLYNKAAEIAAKDHVSVEEYVSVLVADSVASSEFLQSRAARFSLAKFERALGSIPDTEPADDDRT